MPGIQDPERVKQLLKAESRLELVHVIGPQSPAPVQTFNTEEEAKASLGATVPANRRVLQYADKSEPTTAGQNPADQNQAPKKWVIVESPAVVDGSELRNASATQSQGGGDIIRSLLRSSPTAPKKFGALTGVTSTKHGRRF